MFNAGCTRLRQDDSLCKFDATNLHRRCSRIPNLQDFLFQFHHALPRDCIVSVVDAILKSVDANFELG